MKVIIISPRDKIELSGPV